MPMSAPVCLLTRPEAQSREFAERLRGMQVVISPIMRIVPMDFDRAVVDAAPGVVFTSANAVPMAGQGRGRPALCVGPATAQVAANAGWQAEAGTGDAEGLIPMLTGHEGWVHLHGRHVARSLPGLAHVAVYDQVACPLNDAARHVLTGDAPVILPLFSPRSARLLSDAVAGASAPLWTVAISDRANECFGAPAARRVVATGKDAESMWRAMMSLTVAEQS